MKEFLRCKDCLGRQRDSKHSLFLFLPPSFYCWAPVVTWGQLLPPKFLCTLSLGGKTRKGFDCSNPSVLWSQKQSTRWAAVKEMKRIPAQPCGVPQLLVVAACASCLFVVCAGVSSRCCLHFSALKQILTLVQSKFVLWFSPAVCTELIHEKTLCCVFASGWSLSLSV